MEDSAASLGTRGTTSARNMLWSTMAGRPSRDRRRFSAIALAPSGRPDRWARSASTVTVLESSSLVRTSMPSRRPASASDSMPASRKWEVRCRRKMIWIPLPCIAWTYPWLARYWSALRTVLREIPNSSAREFSEGRKDRKG